MTAEEKIAYNSNTIIDLLTSTERKGMDQVIRTLEGGQFFTGCPAHSHHHKWEGGLAAHSLGVYRKALKLENGVTSNSLIIAALLHDVCKAERIMPSIKGHGRRSVEILKRCGLTLSEEERRAIRWHMGHHCIHSEEDQKDAETAEREHLRQVIHTADVMDARGHHHHSN